MSRYRFTTISKNPEVMRIQKEIEDNLTPVTAINDKYNKVTKIEGSPPKVTDLEDGETKVYVSGSTKRRYYRVGGRLFYSELMEV